MTFTGTLNTNEIFSALYSMIISQEVFGDNIASTTSSLVDKARVDGTLYGDQKLYYSTDCLASTEWGNDAEAQNLLVLHRPQAPEVQAIVIDNFRQISLTLDNYLTKQAFADEGTFSAFNSMMMGWMNDTKRIYDATTYNTFIGTTETDVGEQKVTITIPAEPEGVDDYNTEAYNRLKAQAIATAMADLLVAIKDPNRDYNDYGHMRSWNPEDLIVIWNAEVYNELRKLDMPTIFHKDGLIDKFGDEVLPGKYFGTVNTTNGVVGDTDVVRALKEGMIGNKHYFAGELLEAGTSYNANTTYTQDSTIAFKIIHKRSVPYMSAFEVGTSFFNAKSLTTNHYLTFGRNSLEYLKNYPMITARIANAD